MLKKDALKFLKLKETATLDEIKIKYKKLARKYHPDKGGDKDTFLKLSDAYNAAIKDESEADLNKTNTKNMCGGFFSTNMFAAMDREGHRLAENIKMEKREKGYATLSEEQKNVISSLANAVKFFALKKGSSYATTYGKIPYYEFSSGIPELNLLIEPLTKHINTFVLTCDLNAFKMSCDATFKDTTYDKSTPFWIAVHDAFVLVFRAFFRLFDYLITFTTRSEKLMADTYTPFAQQLTGRNHFFEYSTEPKKPSVELKKLSDEFSTALDELESLAPSAEPHKLN